jgi:hypothetical protein
MSRIYIAGAWVVQHQRARPMIAKVREAGLVVTCDWTVAEGDGDGEVRSKGVPEPAVRSTEAVMDDVFLTIAVLATSVCLLWR